MITDLGYRLRILRERKKFTQEQVAKRLNVTKASISNYENNLNTPPIDAIVKLALLFNVSTDYILGLDNKKRLLIDFVTPEQEEILNKLMVEFKLARKASE